MHKVCSEKILPTQDEQRYNHIHTHNVGSLKTIEPRLYDVTILLFWHYYNGWFYGGYGDSRRDEPAQP